MQGNKIKSGKGSTFISYRYGKKTRLSNDCTNKEIKRDCLEEFIISEIEKNILSVKSIPILIGKINEYLKKKEEANSADNAVFEEELREINKKSAKYDKSYPSRRI